MEQRPGAVHYAVATEIVTHGAPVVVDGFAGIAVKQKEAPPGTGLPTIGTPGPITQVQSGEAFVIRLKGLVYTDNVRQEGGAFAVGDPVYIIPAAGANKNKLTAVLTSNAKFGRVEAIAGSRGVGTGKCRINMDSRDSF